MIIDDFNDWFSTKLKKELKGITFTSIITLILVGIIHWLTYSYSSSNSYSYSWNTIEDGLIQNWWLVAFSMIGISFVFSCFNLAISLVKDLQLKDAANKALKNCDNKFNLIEVDDSAYMSLTFYVTEDNSNSSSIENVLNRFAELDIFNPDEILKHEEHTKLIRKLSDNPVIAEDTSFLKEDLQKIDVCIFVLCGDYDAEYLQDFYETAVNKNKTVAVFIKKNSKITSSRIFVDNPPERLVFFESSLELEQQSKKFIADLLKNGFRKTKQLTDSLTKVQGRYKAKKTMSEVAKTQVIYIDP